MRFTADRKRRFVDKSSDVVVSFKQGRSDFKLLVVKIRLDISYLQTITK